MYIVIIEFSACDSENLLIVTNEEIEKYA